MSGDETLFPTVSSNQSLPSSWLRLINLFLDKIRQIGVISVPKTNMLPSTTAIAGESENQIPVPESLRYINQKTGLIPAHC